MTTYPSPTLFALSRTMVDDLPWEPFVGSLDIDVKMLYVADGVVAGLLRLQPGARELTHLHFHGEHHLWVLSGAVVVDDTELVEGSYLHVPSRLAHTIRDGGAGSLAFYVFVPAER
jgi:mannose-6-phosphate isomerase-like protein (cupin superfamily)